MTTLHVAVWISWNWWVLTLIPVAWLLQNCVHEGSHLIVALLTQGRKPTGFYPYPHMHAGRFHFARFTCGVQRWGNISFAPTLIAPFFAGILMLITMLGIKPLFAPEHQIFLAPFGVAGFIDAAWWLRGMRWGSEGCDGKRFKEEMRKSHV